MFDISTISKRYFEISISVKDDEGETHRVQLEVEPPKVKTLRRVAALAKDKTEDSLSEAIKIILSKNRTGYKVPDEIIDELDIDQYNAIFEAYSKWLGEVRNSPN